MSISHFRCQQIRVLESNVRYSYCADYIDCEDLCGIFEIGTDTWEPTIVVRSRFDNGRSVNALIFKIKEHYEKHGELPESCTFAE